MNLHKLFCGGTILCAILTLMSACAKVSEVSDPAQESVPSVSENPAENLVTINAAIADRTKISITQGTATGPLTMAWQNGDKLVVSDHADASVSEVYTIKSGFTSTTASFSGKSVSAGKYDILYGATSVSDANAVNYTSQTQSGNASTGHLKYLALLSDLSGYTEVSFNSAWAASHGAQFKQSGFLRIRADLPGGITSVSKLTVKASDAVFYTTNAMTDKTATLTLNFSPAAAISPTSPLVAYFQLPWGDNPLAAGTVLSVTADDLFTADAPVGGKALAMGTVNDLELELEEPTGDTFAGGTGTSSDPYLIAIPAQMMNVADALVAGGTTCFKLTADINMSGKEWTPLNAAEPYSKAIVLDGDNHTVSNLNSSLFHTLNGTVRNLTLNQSTVAGDDGRNGILAAYINKPNTLVENVTVSDGSISGNCYLGGMIGVIEKVDKTELAATLTGCTVSGTNVSGSLAAGIIGYANSKIEMTNCLYTGGTVTSSARYCGGLVASAGDFASVISGCRVENATIDCKAIASEARCGGLIGMMRNNVTVKGCSVGTSSRKVSIKAGTPSANNKLNVGGFVGVCYGTVTKDGTNRCKACVTITATNAAAGNQMNIGGFGGDIELGAQVEYADAVVVMSSLKGSHIGGFAGIVKDADTRISHCTAEGSVGGNNYTGGFVGAISNGTLTDNTSAGTVGGQSTVGGFAGLIDAGTLTRNSSSASLTPSNANSGGFIGTVNGGTIEYNHASGNISSGGNSVGGFIGQIGDTKTVSISKCYATGNVEGGQNCGGLIGYVGGNLTLSDCYATGNVGSESKNSQKYGSLIGFTTDYAEKSSYVTITNCYGCGNVYGTFACGGLIGRSSLPTVTVSHCAAWSGSVTSMKAVQTNWSSGAVCGVTHPNCVMTGNYRNPEMNLVVYCPPPTDNWDHPDVNGTTTPLYQNSQTAPFTWEHTTATAISAGTDNVDAGRWAYHGKHVNSGTTLSQLASTTLGWSSGVWDFSDDLPTLK